MVYGCGANTVKCLVFFFNFLAFLAGASLLIVSVVAYVSNPVRRYLMDHVSSVDNFDEFRTTLVLGMIVGSIVLILGFFGCCGALAESQCMLATFATVMVLMVLVQVSIGAVILAYKNQLHDGFYNAMNNTAHNAKHGNASDCDFYRRLLNETHCCGFDGNDIGGSCILNCKGYNTTASTVTTGGCAVTLWNDLAKLINAGGIVLLGFVVLEIAALLFSCVLCCAVRRGENLYEQFA